MTSAVSLAPPCFGPLQRADRPRNAGVEIGAGAGDDARGEGRGVELVLGVEDEGSVHGAHPLRRRRPPVQEVQEVPADRVVGGLGVDALAGVAEVVPVDEHRAEGRNEAIGDLAGAGGAVVVLLRQYASQSRYGGAQHVHRMRRRRQRLERGTHRRRQATQRPQPGLVAGELGARRELAVDQEERDLLELTRVGDLEDVVAAVVQVVAGAPHAAQCRVAGGDARQRHGFLGLGGVVHGLFPNSSSSFFS